MEPQQQQEENSKIRSVLPERQAQDKPTISIAAAVITGAAMIALALIIVLHPSATPPAATAPAQTTATPSTNPDISKVNLANEPFIGSATAPVTIAYWFDYQCPFCKQDEETVLPQIIINYVNTGKVKIVFKDFAFLGPDSQTLGAYAHAVWAVDPGKFYVWHKAIFDNQGTENTGWATQSKIISITTSVLGVNETSKVSQLVTTNAGTYQQVMDADKAEAGKFGIQGTPAVLLDTQVITGAQPYTTFQAAINAVLATK